ncbi:MAG: hypothetical protein QME81_04405 [bacterium]|nr:hypothetical protein [bacterium]
MARFFNLMRVLFSLLSAAFLFQAGCSSIKTINITREVNPRVDTKQIKRAAMISLIANEEDEDIGGLIENIFRGETSPHTSFYILNGYEVKNLTEGVEIREAIITNQTKIIELAQQMKVDMLLFLTIDDFEVEKRHDFVLKDYYLPSEHKYQFYKLDYLEITNHLKIRACLLNGSEGQVLWEKEYDQVESKRMLAANEPAGEEYDRDLLKALLKPVTTDFMAMINPGKRSYKRHLVLE